MWQFDILLGLILASYCIAAPQWLLDSNNENFNSLINEVFDINQTRGNDEEGEPGGLRTLESGRNPNDLINNIYGNNQYRENDEEDKHGVVRTPVPESGRNLNDLINNIYGNNQYRENDEEDKPGGSRTPAPESGRNPNDLINNIYGNNQYRENDEEDKRDSLRPPTVKSGGNLDDFLTNSCGNDQDRGNNEEDKPGDLGTPASEFGNFTVLIQSIFYDDIEPNDKHGKKPGPGIDPINPKDPRKPEACQCVPYYQCQNRTIVQNGMGFIDIRLGHSSKGNRKGSHLLPHQCENYLEICCGTAELDTAIPNQPWHPKVNGCGVRHTKSSYDIGYRLAGDNNNEAQFGEFPWTVLIFREERINQQAPGDVSKYYLCCGALIHPRAVLTGAHCVFGRQLKHLKVRAGDYDIQMENDIVPHQDRDVSKIIIHEEFDSGTLFNDVAILLLSEPVDLAENVNVVCLSRPSDHFDYSRCFASGWGKDVFGPDGQYPGILKKVEVPIIPRDTCQNSLSTTRLGSYFILDQSFICAGGEPGKDMCKGDGGSPLVCPLKNDPQRYAQAGITSWGIGCGEDGIPGVYTSVAHARRWIDEKMAYNNLDMSTYTY